MVTYISSANADRYTLLFEKASDALGLTEDNSISSLNEYFAHLEDLIAATSSDNEDISRFFVRLPLDEDLFEIDANSRTVKVPNTSFGRYGVGVQGDELAEVVYFIIDRFFDATDLASDHMKIVIQWEAKDADRNTIAGISQHFGKDIESVPGKIIFGWPISSELTAAPGTIKFAVRFYLLGENTEENNARLVYSFSTLPAEVNINASLDYDIINMSKIDHGNIITSRIKSDGVYDTGEPIPNKPIITIPLYVMSPEGNGLRVVDLPAGENSMVKLAISARKDNFGNLVYDWQKRPYDSVSSEYKESVPIASEIEYEEVIPSEFDLYDEFLEYYTVTFDEDERITAVYLVTQDRMNTITIENNQFLENGNPIHLYKKLSVCSANTVGEYYVNIKAKTTVNSSLPTTNANEPIRIPGPLKPTINLPEESENVSVTDSDKVTHIITQDSNATLTVNAIAGEYDNKTVEEVGENPQVSLEYSWKQIVDGSVISVDGAIPGPVSARILGRDEIPAMETDTEEVSRDNQEAATLTQDGNNIVIYGTLGSYISTNPRYPDPEKWLAIDIDTGKESIVGLNWRSEDSPLGQEDEDEALSLGLGLGHIIFWANINNFPESILVDDTVLRFSYSENEPSNLHYEFKNNCSEMIIKNLPEGDLDNSYICEVTATRNKVTTTEQSGIYRVTNAPQKPVLSYNGGPVDRIIHTVAKNFRGTLATLHFEVDENIPHDNLIYLWMHATIDNDADYDDYNAIKAQIDLDGALSTVIGEQTAWEGTKDTIVDPDVAHYENDLIVFGTSSGESSYQLKDSDKGIFYCIVINELNNNKAASVGPFFAIQQS